MSATPDRPAALERTLRRELYFDDAVFARERERIFRSAWHYVGRTDQVRRHGDYFATRAGDVPVVVVRDGEALNAFANVCRHRLSEVVQGEGHRRTLQCAYHGWTYALDGTLRSAPRSEREGGFDKSELSLVPVQVDTWGPFVFVNASAEAPPLAEALGDLPRVVASRGLDVGALEFRERVEYELAANWKVVVENYLECYHCPLAHPGFTKLVDVDPDAYRLDANGRLFSQFGPVCTSPDVPYDADGEVTEAHFHLVWPTFRVNVYPGRPNVSVGPLIPVAPERTAAFLDYFFAPDVSDEDARSLIAFDDEVGREDRVLVESVQRGIRSGIVERGRLLPESERLIHGFEALLEEALTRPRSRSEAS